MMPSRLPRRSTSDRSTKFLRFRTWSAALAAPSTRRPIAGMGLNRLGGQGRRTQKRQSADRRSAQDKLVARALPVTYARRLEFLSWHVGRWLGTFTLSAH